MPPRRWTNLVREGPLRSIGLFGLAQAAALAAGLILHGLVARSLSLGDYGRFVVAHSVLLAMLVLLTSAVPNALRRLVSLHPERVRTAWRTVWRVQLPLALVLATGLALLAPSFSELMSDPLLAPVLWIVAAELVVRGGILEPGWHLLNGTGRHALQAALLFVHAVLRVVCVAVALWLDGDLTQAMWGLFASSVASASILLPVIRYVTHGQATVGPLDAELMTWIRFAPAADVLNYIIVPANLWIVKATAGDDSLVGGYAACYMLAQVFVPFSVVLSRGCFSPFARAVGAGDRSDAVRVLRGAGIVSLAMALVGIVSSLAAGEAIVRIVYGGGIPASAPLLALLCVGMWGAGTLWYLCEMLAAAGRLRTRLVLTVTVTGLNLVVTPLAADARGAPGAAWALAMTTICGLAAACCLLHGVLAPSPDTSVSVCEAGVLREGRLP